MILVGGLPIVTENSPIDTENLLLKLLDHPELVASAKAMTQTQVLLMKPPYPSGNEDFDLRKHADVPEVEVSSKYVFIFQKEYATVSPVFAELAGTDEITTCLGLVIRDPLSGLTSTGHFDTVKCVSNGVAEMVNSMVSAGTTLTFQVHMLGAFDDSSDFRAKVQVRPPSDSREVSTKDGPMRPGWSWPLALRMIETLQSSAHHFNIETCCILKHNTSIGPFGHPCPTIRGFVVETSSGRFLPAYFEQESRGPDGTVRAVYTTILGGNKKWDPTLVSPYDSVSDTFVIQPFTTVAAARNYTEYMLRLPDDEFLQNFSTSPYAEGPDFVPTSRRMFHFMKSKPSVSETFPSGEPRVFTRTSSGGWVRK